MILQTVLIALTLISSAQAADEAPVTETQPEVTEVKPAATELITEEKPVPQKRRRPKENKDQYRESKYTSDRSEKEADHRSLVLAAGVDKVVDLDPSIQIEDFAKSKQVGNPRLIAVTLGKVGKSTQMIIRPLEEGETSIIIRDKNGRIPIIFDVFVAKQNLVSYLKRLQDKLKEVEGITLAIEDNKVVIRGEVLSPNDYGIIVNELGEKAYANSVLNKVTMSNTTLNELAKKIAENLRATVAPTLNASVINGKIILEGSVEDAASKARALQKAEWFLPLVKVSDPINASTNIEKNDKPLQLIQSDIQIIPPQKKRESKQVKLAIYFVELSKDFLKTFGFKWQPGFTADPSISVGSTAAGTESTGGGGFTFAGTLSSLFPSLNAPPSSASYGRILKSATVIVKSAEQATLTDSQLIPTQTLGQNGTVADGAPLEVGFDVKITPTIMQNQDIDVNVDLKQTNQVGQNGLGKPLVNKHSVITRIYLKSGEVGAVAGMNTQDVTTAFNRDDATSTGSFSGSTKPLFTLMRSKNMKKIRGQFVVFVSPQVIDRASDGSEELNKSFRMKSN